MSESPFAPIRRNDGYLPIEDYGLIGNGATSALVGRNGSIDWLCVPRFDSPPLFSAILDYQRGGCFSLELEEGRESRQRYEEGTGILITEIRAPSALIRITDAMPLHSDADLTQNAPGARHELLRRIEALHGDPKVRMRLAPFEGVTVEAAERGLLLRCGAGGDLLLALTATRRMTGQNTTFQLQQGDRVDLLMQWGETNDGDDPLRKDLLQPTVQAWRHWISGFDYDGPQNAMVQRSAITLKMLDHFENGAIVAAPTSSLPESIGGVRNWDYRYTWIRDAALSVYALNRVGLTWEAESFLRWVLKTSEQPGHPRLMYKVDTGIPEQEQIDERLEGYRQSQPVRWGNGAADQIQHDIYGEILDCAYQWTQRGPDRGDTLRGPLWSRLQALVEAASREWRTPDHGIWEVRSAGSTFTYSAALCHVAFDRAIHIAKRFGLEGDTQGWHAEADEIQRRILEEAWNESVQAIGATLQGHSLDASVLSLPLRRVIPGDHPKMQATRKAISERLGAGNGLVFRYDPDDLDDGLPGEEGAFLLCSFWLVDNLALENRLDEALDMYDSLCGRAGPLGLLPEQIDPSTGAFLGNYPQAFSHVGVIASGVRLGRAIQGRQEDSRKGR